MTDSRDITKLLDWLEGRLTEEEDMAVAAAVQASGSHQRTVDWLRTFLSLSRSTVLIEPPDELLQDMTARFQAFARDQRQDGWLRRLVATLMFDSWQRSSLVGVRRSGLDLMPRQMVYRAETADIALNTRAGSAGPLFDLVGQIFPRDDANPASFIVQLMREELEVALTHTNNVGKFTFTALAAGIYTIVVRGDQDEITIADVALSFQ